MKKGKGRKRGKKEKGYYKGRENIEKNVKILENFIKFLNFTLLFFKQFLNKKFEEILL